MQKYNIIQNHVNQQNCQSSLNNKVTNQSFGIQNFSISSKHNAKDMEAKTWKQNLGFSKHFFPKTQHQHM
jgi:hypothetical protein